MWPAKLLKDYTVGTKSVEHRERLFARKEEKEKKNVPRVQFDCIPGKMCLGSVDLSRRQYENTLPR